MTVLPGMLYLGRRNFFPFSQIVCWDISLFCGNTEAKFLFPRLPRKASNCRYLHKCYKVNITALIKHLSRKTICLHMLAPKNRFRESQDMQRAPALHQSLFYSGLVTFYEYDILPLFNASVYSLPSSE